MLIELPIAWIIVLNVAGWGVIQMGFAWAFTQLAAERLDAESFFARPWSWERSGRVYERLFGIKAWKDKLPDAASWFRSGIAKAHLGSHGREALARFARETWRGELCHWAALACAPLFFLWNPWWGDWIIVAYALAANLPCILAQRYNRARFLRLAARVKSRA